jgi:stearoyl-CoA desaturase (delta-9 desaturase)
MHTDTVEDPHSPSFHPGLWGTMLQTRNCYQQIHTGKIPHDAKMGKDLPQWVWFEKFAHNWITRIVWIIIYSCFYYYFVTAWWMWLLLPFTIILCSFQGAVINWWAHSFGYVNYSMRNTSTNLFPFDPIFMGDAYHNNHHRYPGRINNAHRWFEFDFIYLVMRSMKRFGMISWNSGG